MKVFGCQTPNTAPVGSAKNAIRPMSITSIGATTTVPPAAVTLAAASSASATLTYVAHAVGWPSCMWPIRPATFLPSCWNMRYPPVSAGPGSVALQPISSP